MTLKNLFEQDTELAADFGTAVTCLVADNVHTAENRNFDSAGLTAVLSAVVASA